MNFFFFFCSSSASFYLCFPPFFLSLMQAWEEIYPKNPAVVADMTALHHIHEPGILHNLKERSRPWRQTPYTFIVSLGRSFVCKHCFFGWSFAKLCFFGYSDVFFIRGATVTSALRLRGPSVGLSVCYFVSCLYFQCICFVSFFSWRGDGYRHLPSCLSKSVCPFVYVCALFSVWCFRSWRNNGY